MCRSIKPLFNFDPPASTEEMEAASLQFVRKVTGFTAPSVANEAAFSDAVQQITGITEKLFAAMTSKAPHKNREAEAAKRQARARR